MSRGSTPSHRQSGRWSDRLRPLLFAWLLIGSGAQHPPGLCEERNRTPAEAVEQMKLPTGFRATLFAGEPDVVQPIAFTFDDRGRLWVVECLSYPEWKPEGQGNDRIVIFEDTDGDGRFDKRQVFFDRGTNLSGIEWGFGGVWLCATPQFLFLPDRNADDVPDGPPEVLLDGWDLKAKHNVFNGLKWGPDGWLYGCNGILSNSRIGKPGTAEQDRTEMNCGVWRYHPTRHDFEVVAHGTTNPWGLDFDQYGQMFITNCVIHHLFHVIPGARFQRMFGQDFNTHSYHLLESCADHIHWGGGQWTDSRGGQGIHDQPGGGHAHAGAMIYLGDNWPDEYRGSLYTCNIHGKRVNCDQLIPSGSGYVAKHARDLLAQPPDSWFRGLELKAGPDGGVYLTDWNDMGECHDYEEVERQTGRIFKITYGDVSTRPIDLARQPDIELVEWLFHKNAWLARHAQRILQERATPGRLDGSVRARLESELASSDEQRALAALWALHVTGPDPAILQIGLRSAHPHVRGWSVAFELEDRRLEAPMLSQLVELAATDPSASVRLRLASGLQRLEPDQRWSLAEALMAHPEDADDDNLPLMIWYGVEPLVSADRERGAALIAKCRIPLVRQLIARRIADGTEAALDPLVPVLGALSDPGGQLDLLRGIQAATRGRRQVAKPAGWESVYETLTRATNAGNAADSAAGVQREQVRSQATLLAIQMNDQVAVQSARGAVSDVSQPAERRADLLEALVQHQDPEALSLLLGSLDDPALRGAAIRNLAAYEDPRVPRAVLERYAALEEPDRAHAISTLASRPRYALALLAAIEEQRVPARDVTAFTARQLAALNDAQLTERLEQVWGSIRSTSEDKKALVGQYKSQLAQWTSSDANVPNGRAVYDKTCAACHRLFGTGGTAGPELTGAQRTSADYVLENLLDPNAVVGRDFQMQVITTQDGRILNGIIKEENDVTLAVQTPNEVVFVPKAEIETRETSRLSLMPEGILEKLAPEEIRDLLAYLASPAPVAREPRPREPGAGAEVEPFVDRVVSFEPGAGAGFGKDGFPMIVLGPPRGGGKLLASTHVLALGQRGRITLEFVDNEVVDGPGPDILIFENAFLQAPGNNPDQGFFELARVEVSVDGVEWKPFPYDTGTKKGCAGYRPVLANSEQNSIQPTDAEQAGGDAFDLMDVGLKRARFVRITDLDNGRGENGTAGFDLDAIVALHSVARQER